MTAQNNLEIKGNLKEHPLAELLVEISETHLDGSLRLATEAQKTIIYFREGKVVFAVSNARQHRIFEMLLQVRKFTKEQLLKFPNFTNDLEFAQTLLEKGVFNKLEIASLFTQQIKGILHNALSWPEGIWNFSPLTKIKESIEYKIDVNNLLIEHARTFSEKEVIKRFKSLRESYGVKPNVTTQRNFLPQEAFVLSRFGNAFLSVEQIKNLSGMSDIETMQILYTLWLGGFLFRKNWSTAFSERQVADILSAKLRLKKDETVPDPVQIKPVIELSKPVEEPAYTKEKVKVEEKSEPAKPQISLEEYLNRIETANSLYETLNISPKSSEAEIKQAYFSVAKQFHPDLFYKKADAGLHQKIQYAFTEIAFAYETLRNVESRKVYDFRMRKELEYMQKVQTDSSSAGDSTEQRQARQGLENFDQGFSLLMEEDYEEAVTHLARAVHLVPDNARYHAYLGKALSADETQRHKAEAELQTAIKLEPNNPMLRIMLVEFFIDYGLNKRAEGELNRLLAIAPDHKEAQALLDSLQNK